MALIRQIHIQNYKSIADAAVDLTPFTVLVGRNGAGKSNFINAVAFVHDCLTESIELAFKNRGGIAAVRRMSGGHPTDIGIRVILELEDGGAADYSFEIKTEKTENRFSVKRERCMVREFMGSVHKFELEGGKFKEGIPGVKPKLAPDRLALFAASAVDEFRPVYDFLTSMRFYSISPEKVRDPQDPDAGDYLKYDGGNAAAVLKRIQQNGSNNTRYEKVCSLLSKVVDGVKGVEHKQVGRKESIQFKKDVGTTHPWTFDAWNMSDGTLRVLGLLLAIYQPGNHSVIAIEEPEATVHPAAAEVVIQALMDASRYRQIILTTHSPDILDNEEISDNQIKVVEMKDGKSAISPLSSAGSKAIRQHLYTAGELLRIDELHGDSGASGGRSRQMKLFGQAFPEDQRKE